MQPASTDLRAPVSQPAQQVHHLRQILLWPLRLVALRRGDDVQRRAWELLGADQGRQPVAPHDRRVHRLGRALS